MRQPTPDMKLTKAQYQEILRRTMDRQGKSVAQDLGGMQQSMMGGGMPGGMPAGLSPTGQASFNPGGLDPMTQAQQPMSFAPPVDPLAGPMTQAPQMTQQPPSLTEVMSEAQENWKSIKTGLAGKIWDRLFANTPQKGIGSPEQMFIKEYAKYKVAPDEVISDQVRQFFDTLAESGQLQSAKPDPLAAAVMSPGLGGM